MHVWRDCDLIALLAWLDFSLADKLSFWTSITSKLDEYRQVKTGEGVQFTHRQIRNKLLSLTRGKVKPSLKLGDILEKGTSCIPRLAPEILVEVGRLVKVFERDYSKSRDTQASIGKQILKGPKEGPKTTVSLVYPPFIPNMHVMSHAAI